MPDRVHSPHCARTAWQLCLGCGARVCACHGVARGQCPECFRGLLTNYYKIGHKCGYKNCTAHAAVASPRVGFACLHHAIKSGYSPISREGDGQGSPTEYTRRVARALGISLEGTP